MSNSKIVHSERLPVRSTNASEKKSPKTDNEGNTERVPLKDNSTKVAKILPLKGEPRLSTKTLAPVSRERVKKDPRNHKLPIPAAAPKSSMTKLALVPPVKAPVKGLRQKREESFNTMRIPSSAHVGLTQEKIQSRLRKKSPWYDSITSPITGGGVKIPDPIGTDTGTYQHVQNVSVNVNAGGVCGLRIVSPYINLFNGSIGSHGSNFQISNQSSITNQVLWGDGVTNLGWMYPFAVIPDLMRANARAHRIVSAAVIAQPETSTLNDAGEMCAFVTPLDCRVNGTTSQINYSDYQAQWDSTMIPVNSHKPVIARWYPVEGEYQEFGGQAFSSVDDLISYRDFVKPGEANTSGVIPWEFGVVCSGMTPSTGVVRFQIIVNYEFIPLLGTAMVAVDPSPVDPMEEQLVNHWVSMDPVTSVISQKEASKAPTTTKVAEEPTGFGMLFNVIEEMMPTIVQTVPKLLSLL